MNLAGLAPDRAPPVEAPLVLFYLMPVFLGLAGLVLAWQGGQVMASRWSPAALAVTHLVVLGTLAPVMCGALLQISPVLLGAPYAGVRLVARLTAAGLGLGSLLVGGGFLLTRPGLLLTGGGVVAAAVTVFLAASFRALAAAAGRRETLWAVRLALSALAVTVTLGLTLALVRHGWLELPGHLTWVQTHVAWGLAGWVGLLLAGVGMEVIPFFYLSPAFDPRLRRALPFAVFALLLMITALGALANPSWPALQGLIAALFLAHLLYNAAALHLEQRRQRPRRDASLWLWQASHAGVFAGFFAWLVDAPPSLVGTLLLGGALSFVIGSLLKIVPFLSWLDLQQRRAASRHPDVSLPRLHTLLPQGQATLIAATLGAALLALLSGAWVPQLAQLGGALLMACAGLLAHLLISAARLRGAVIRQLGAPAGGPGRGSRASVG